MLSDLNQQEKEQNQYHVPRANRLKNFIQTKGQRLLDEKSEKKMKEKQEKREKQIS